MKKNIIRKKNKEQFKKQVKRVKKPKKYYLNLESKILLV